VLALVAGCSFRHGATSDASIGALVDAPHDLVSSMNDVPRGNGNGFDKAITVQRSQVAGDVTQFPVWIALSGDADLATYAHDDHGDVYFTDASGNAIPYEITGWDRPNGVLQAWVLAGHLTPSMMMPDPNQIHLRYGGPAAPMPSNGAAVFVNGFAAVWHLDGLTSTTVPDATNTTPGTLTGSVTTTGGQLGKGVSFSGTASSVAFTNPLTSNSSSTMSAWVDEATPAGTGYSYALVVLGTATKDQARWFYASHGGHNNSLCAGLYLDDEIPGSPILVGLNTWHKLDWTFDPGARTSKLYVDGTQVDSQTLGNSNTSGAAGMFANVPSTYLGPAAFDGILDELRIANTVRSAMWLKTEWNNQSSPGTFYVVGNATAL
jgi:hypothetical protein